MEEISLKEIASCLSFPINTTVIIKSVITDSREKMNNSSLFLALKGERFDAHDFISEAYKNGARYFVVNKKIEDFKDATFIVVENTLEALGKIASLYRQKFDIPVIGVTGSVGKTTVKELTALFLSAKYNTLKTEGNLNNEIGLPKTLLNISKENTAVVVEMGMNHQGEIRRLSKIASPTLCVITNAYPVHIEFFNSTADIARAKSEIYEGLRENSVAVINKDSEFVSIFTTKALEKASEIVFFSASDARVVSNSSFEYKGVLFKHNLPGRFNTLNILAALKIASYYEVSLKDCARLLKDFRSEKNRMDIIALGNSVIINDTYNSNPAALKAMLEYLSTRDEKIKVAVIGDMLELGKEGERLHREVAEYISSLKNIDVVYSYGQVSVALADGINKSILYKHFTTQDELKESLIEYIDKNSAILVKGSRGMKLDSLVSSLAREASPQF